MSEEQHTGGETETITEKDADEEEIIVNDTPASAVVAADETCENDEGVEEKEEATTTADPTADASADDETEKKKTPSEGDNKETEIAGGGGGCSREKEEGHHEKEEDWIPLKPTKGDEEEGKAGADDDNKSDGAVEPSSAVQQQRHEPPSSIQDDEKAASREEGAVLNPADAEPTGVAGENFSGGGGSGEPANTGEEPPVKEEEEEVERGGCEGGATPASADKEEEVKESAAEEPTATKDEENEVLLKGQGEEDAPANPAVVENEEVAGDGNVEPAKEEPPVVDEGVTAVDSPSNPTEEPVQPPNESPPVDESQRKLIAGNDTPVDPAKDSPAPCEGEASVEREETIQQQQPAVESAKESPAADEGVAPVAPSANPVEEIPPADIMTSVEPAVKESPPAAEEKAPPAKSSPNLAAAKLLLRGLPPIAPSDTGTSAEPAKESPAADENVPAVTSPTNISEERQQPKRSIDEKRQRHVVKFAPVEPVHHDIVSDDEVEFIEEIILYEDDIIIEDEVIDDESEHVDDGTDGGKIIADASAFRAAAKNITELLTQNGTPIEMSEATQIIQDKHKTVNIVYKHFPGSLSCHTIFDKVKSALKRHGYNNSSTNDILFAHSLCPDEQDGRHNNINLTKLFEVYFGGSPGISLGGLAGIPFAGKSGFTSFAHNVPEKGHGFVLLAPHIGLDSVNELGKCNSTTPDSFPYCCRAAVNALHYCCSARPIPDLNDHPEEYQMNYLIQYLNRRKDMITDEEGQNTKQADLAKTIHAITKNFLDKIVNPLFLGGPDSTLLIFTGIQINMPEPFDDFFQPKHFYILKKDGKKVDLFKETFAGAKMQSSTAASAPAPAPAPTPPAAEAPAGKQKFCTSCGVKNRPEAKFCGDCGHKF